MAHGSLTGWSADGDHRSAGFQGRPTALVILTFMACMAPRDVIAERSLAASVRRAVASAALDRPGPSPARARCAALVPSLRLAITQSWAPRAWRR